MAETIDTVDIIQHYRDVVRGVLEWDGMPDGMPPGYINDTCLFYGRGFGAKDVPGLGVCVMPVNPSTLDIYGQPVEWLPAFIDGVTAYRQGDITPGLYEPSTEPVCWLGWSMLDKIRPYVQIMERVLSVLGTNIYALSQPVLISGIPSGSASDNVSGILLKSDLVSGQAFIPVVEGRGAQMEVLDLKAQDHTQNLISTLQACDARILEILDTSNGIQKSSGITVAETATGEVPVQLSVDAMLERCRDWCDRANDSLGTSFSVSRGRAIEDARKDPQPRGPVGGTEDDTAE